MCVLIQITEHIPTVMGSDCGPSPSLLAAAMVMSISISADIEQMEEGTSTI